MRSTFSRGTVSPNEDSAIIGGVDTYLKTRRKGVIFCHGSGDLTGNPFIDQQWLFHGLSDFATIHVGDLGGETWGNDTGIARIGAAIAHLRNEWGVEGKIALVAMSMGHAVASAYAQAFPDDVACIAGTIPLIDIRDAFRFANSPVHTYRWQGQTNNSISEKVNASGGVVASNLFMNPQPDNALYWDASGSSGVVSFITNSQGRPAVLATLDGTANWALYTARRGPAPLTSSAVVGDVYTIKYTVKSSFANGFSMKMGYGATSAQFASGDSPVLTPGVETTRTWTFTVPPEGAGQPIFIKPYFTESQAPDGVNTFELSDIMVVKSVTSPAYFDGDTTPDPGAIDLAYSTSKKIDYAWSSTPHGSTSTRTVPGGGSVTTNYVVNPSFETNISNWNPWGTTVAATTARVASSTAKFGGFTNRCTFTAAGTSIATGQPSLASSPNSIPGELWHAFAWIRASVPITAQCRVGYFTRSGVVARGETQGPLVNVPANTWVPITASGTTPDLADAVRPNLVIASRTWAINDWFEVDGAFQNKGPTAVAPEDYFDGSFTDVMGFNEYTDGPTHNPAQMNLPTTIPHKLWCATEDPFTPIEIAQAYAAAHPEVELVNIGAWGHTDAAVTMATPGIVEFVRAHL